MTTEIRFEDAAYPPKPLAAGVQGVVFYAGGDTPHVWTYAETRQYDAQYLMPLWVRSNPGQADPAKDASDYLNVLRNVYKAPPGVLVAVDTETSSSPSYMVPFVTAMNSGGYPVIDYGSQASVFGNRNPDGYYWGAQWTGVPHIATGDQATQYVSFPQYDLSEFESTLPLWNLRPVPLQAGEDMLNDQFTGQRFVPFPAGSFKTLYLMHDFTGANPVPVRVAVHSASKGYLPTEHHELSGSGPVEVPLVAADANGVSLWVQSAADVGFTLA